MHIGQRLRQLREERGYTLAEVAQKANISISHLSAVENGSRPNPSFAVVANLAHAYNVPLSYFDENAKASGEDGAESVVAETKVDYQEIAKRLAEADALENPSRLLELLAEYLRDRDATKREDAT